MGRSRSAAVGRSEQAAGSIPAALSALHKASKDLDERTCDFGAYLQLGVDLMTSTKSKLSTQLSTRVG